MKDDFIYLLQQSQYSFHQIVDFDYKKEKIIQLDFTSNNTELNEFIFNDIGLFSDYINSTLNESKAKFGIGGYLENRTIYSRSNLFENSKTENRTLHLGIDIWGEINTNIYAPLDATIHNFAFNNNHGDYGATIILEHNLDGFIFHSLYGHLSLKNIQQIKEGDLVKKGEYFANFGGISENGNWPPHLHFQIIKDLEGLKGDYPGVCALSQKEKYAINCPNPDLILQLNRFV